MQSQKTDSSLVMNVSHEESILVIPRTILFEKGSWRGLKSFVEKDITELIMKKREFMPRSLAEENADFKQIIPYLVFNYQDRYFLMQRRLNAREKRLQGCYSLGIGGHIRLEDMTTPYISDWARREFYEEVDYKGSVSLSLLGVLNDDSNEVGRVHIGFVYFLTGDSPFIRVKEELRSGELVALKDCYKVYPQMETWSQMVVDYLDTKDKEGVML